MPRWNFSYHFAFKTLLQAILGCGKRYAVREEEVLIPCISILSIATWYHVAITVFGYIPPQNFSFRRGHESIPFSSCSDSDSFDQEDCEGTAVRTHASHSNARDEIAQILLRSE